MTNDMSNQFGSYQGDYHVSAEVNGKPSYVNDAHAIWFISTHNIWLMGNLADIGQSVWNPNVLLSYDEFYWLTVDNQWRYWNGATWMPSSDISIDLTTDHFMYYIIVKPISCQNSYSNQYLYHKVTGINLCY